MAAGTDEDKEKMGTKIRSKFVFAMFYVLGTLTHVTQAFYVTANDYWMYKFKNSDDAAYNSSNTDEKTDLQTKFFSYYTIVANVFTVAGLILTFFTIKSFRKVQIGLIVSLSTLLALLVVTVILVWVDTDTWQTGFFIISLAIGALLNGFGATFSISVVYLAMEFPAVYLGAVLSGQSICGILSAVVQILTLAMDTSSKISAFIYFLLGVVMVAAVQALYLGVMVKESYYQERINSGEKAVLPKFTGEKVKVVAKKVAVILLTLTVTAGSTVALHPGITALVESTDKGEGRWGDSFFVPVCTFLAFNVFEFVGRECSVRLNVLTNTYVILIAAILRLVLVPLLLFCNVQPRHLPVLFDEDYSYLIFMSAFALTNGYLINLCVVILPRICDEEEMKIAAFLITFVLLVSLAACSFLSSVLIKVI